MKKYRIDKVKREHYCNGCYHTRIFTVPSRKSKMKRGEDRIVIDKRGYHITCGLEMFADIRDSFKGWYENVYKSLGELDRFYEEVKNGKYG